jgi:hypothetical protein
VRAVQKEDGDRRRPWVGSGTRCHLRHDRPRPRSPGREGSVATSVLSHGRAGRASPTVCPPHPWPVAPFYAYRVRLNGRPGVGSARARPGCAPGHWPAWRACRLGSIPGPRPRGTRRSHHHTATSMLALAFLVLQRARLGEKRATDDRARGGSSPRPPAGRSRVERERNPKVVPLAAGAESQGRHRPSQAAPRRAATARRAT